MITYALYIKLYIPHSLFVFFYVFGAFVVIKGLSRSMKKKTNVNRITVKKGV